MSSLSIQTTKTRISGVLLVTGDVYSDNRGHFFRNYSKDVFERQGINWDIVQTSVSINYHEHTLRGFHYQNFPSQENKLLGPVTGSIVDIVVDLREHSDTYLQWESFVIYSNAYQFLHIPEGCANAWMTLENNTIVLYHMSEYFDEKNYSGFRYNDPTFNFEWPFLPRHISDRDLSYPNFEANK